jgi:hypothetical protein
MTLDDRFGRSLSTWLTEEAEHRVPDHLAEVLVRTAATRQRPWWSSLERLLPMTTMTTGRVLARPPVFWLALLVLATLALVGAALLVGSLRTTPTPLGPASNGRIIVVDGSSIVSYAAGGTDRVDLLQTTAGASSLSMSPDGTRVAFAAPTMPPSVHVVSVADGSEIVIDVLAADVLFEEPVGWSPDGSSVTLAGIAGDREQLFVVAVDGSSVTTPIEGSFDRDLEIKQPSFSPDGEWIVFATHSKRTGFGKLHVVRADGTDLRELPVPSVVTQDGGGPLWSPAGDAHRIAYLTFANDELVTRVFDLDTDSDHAIGPGFWPSWAPDGSRLATCCATVVDVDDAIAGRARPITVFGQFPGNCPEAAPTWTGRAICSAVVWSPDGEWLIAGDIAGRDLLLAPVDGSVPPRRIEMESVSRFEGFMLPVAWQPVWP